jgi:hypothetical protein
MHHTLELGEAPLSSKLINGHLMMYFTLHIKLM